jgi:Zn-finger nucleic acid-binding protein
MALKCPRCSPINLEEIELSDIPIDRCPRCAGLWFDNAEVTATTGLKTELLGFESIVPPTQFAEKEMYCPRCDDVVLRRLDVQGDGRNQILYRCVSCLGTWIDRGELREEEDPNLLNALRSYFSKTKFGK